MSHKHRKARARRHQKRKERREDRREHRHDRKEARRDRRLDNRKDRRQEREDRIKARKSAKIARAETRKARALAKFHSREVKYTEKSEGGAYSPEHAEAVWGGISDSIGNVAEVAAATAGGIFGGGDEVGDALSALGAYGGGGEGDQGPLPPDEGSGELGPLGLASPMVEYAGMAIVAAGGIYLLASPKKKHAA